MSRAHSYLFILAICIALSGCRGLVSTGPANQIQVTLNQYFVNLGINANTQFAATVTGATNTNVTWSVDKIAGGNSTVGTITAAALYSAPPQAGTHTVTVASVADPTKTATATVTVLDFLLSPLSALVAPGATQQFSTAIPVNWSVDGVVGGNAAAGTINSSGLYTAPLATGAHGITATSTANPALSASAALTVVNSSPGAVLTYHNNNARDGAFTEETVLIPSNIGSAHFGKLLSYPVDGQIYAQPLYLPQVSIAGANHDVVFVATENNSVYAFDAKGSQATPLWTKSLGTATPRNDTEGVSPLLGITSTPVIDVTTGTLYVLAETTNAHFQLHALDISSAAEKFGGPVTVTGSVSGTGLDNAGGTITLENACYQRMGLALNPVTNMIYLAFGHCNHGWILAYDKTTLQLTATFNDTPNGAGGGLWAGGGAPAIDDVTGDLYLITGVDQNDPSSGYNDAFLRLSGKDLSVLDFFQPDNEAFLRANDADLGAGATILMPDDSSGSPRETIGGGKDGRVFVVNRDSMGSFSPTADNVFEIVQTGVQQFDNIFSTPVYWNGSLYYHCESDVLHAFSWSNGLLSTQPVSSGNSKFAMHGATPSLSSNGMQSGIIWEIDNTNYGSGSAVLHASDATNVGNELYNSSQAGSRDTAGMALKFTLPTIAGGRVFVPTANELDIYGLLGP